MASVGLWVVDGHRLPLPPSSREAPTAAAAAAASAEHLLLLRALGITHLVVAVTRQDECRWCSSRFAATEQLLLQLCVQTAGFAKGNISVLPVAALPGVNLVPLQQQQQQQELLLQLAAARRNGQTQGLHDKLQMLVQQQQEQQQLLLQWWKGLSLLETIERLPVSCCCSNSSSSSCCCCCRCFVPYISLCISFTFSSFPSYASVCAAVCCRRKRAAAGAAAAGALLQLSPMLGAAVTPWSFRSVW